MDKDSFSAGLIVVLVIVLTSGAALFFKLNGQLAELEKSAAERDTLRGQLESMKTISADNNMKLTEHLEEIEQLHGHIGVMGECMDRVLQAWTGKISDESNNPVRQIIKAEWPQDDLRRDILRAAEEPCKRSYEIIRELKVIQKKSTVSPFLDSKVPGSR